MSLLLRYSVIKILLTHILSIMVGVQNVLLKVINVFPSRHCWCEMRFGDGSFRTSLGSTLQIQQNVES